MAFEAILIPRAAMTRGRRLIMPLSGLAHLVALSAAAAQSFWQVDELPLPAIEVTLTVAPPPPAPPPPPKRSSSHPKTKPLDRKPKTVTAPKESPKAEPEPAAKDEREEDNAGEDEGKQNGVPGGTTGGVGDAPSPPPAKSTGPKLLSDREGHGLLAIDPNKRPYKVELSEELVERGDSHAAELYICVNEQGAVSSMRILRPSIPEVDLQIPFRVKKWRYKPYLVDGRPTPFCYRLRYVVR